MCLAVCRPTTTTTTTTTLGLLIIVLRVVAVVSDELTLEQWLAARGLNGTTTLRLHNTISHAVRRQDVAAAATAAGECEDHAECKIWMR